MSPELARVGNYIGVFATGLLLAASVVAREFIVTAFFLVPFVLMLYVVFQPLDEPVISW